MALIGNSFVAFVAISLLLTLQVQGECNTMGQIPQMNQKDIGAYGEFMQSLECGIEKSVKTVGDTLKDGYDYLKKKISPTPTLEDRVKNFVN